MAFLQPGLTLKALLENPDLLKPPKAQDVEEKDVFEKKDPNAPQSARPNQSAFLGPQLWDKTLPVDLMGDFQDFKLEYMDLDEFFDENSAQLSEDLDKLAESTSMTAGKVTQGLSLSPCPSPQEKTLGLLENLLAGPASSPALLRDASLTVAAVSPDTSRNAISHCGGELGAVTPAESSRSTPSPRLTLSPGTTRNKVADDIDLVSNELMFSNVPGVENFDPKKRSFSVDELRPQPVVKKSKKVFVPDTQKDDKYWSRRNKNNVAAKRSREARRVKENQIALRAAFLERENEKLAAELEKARKENADLRRRLSVYEKS